jgi:hypothetical protein
MLLCMRTTFDLNDEVLRQAKRKAADEGVPLRDVVEAALRYYIKGPRKTTRYRLKWRTERGKLAPGVSLDDRSSLIDFMEEGD